MKKIISLLLTVVILCSLCVTAFATTDYTNGTQVEYVGKGAESYTITVPAQLAPGQGGTVTLSGTWASDKAVKVTADATVTLVNSINANDQKVLDVTFIGIEKAGNNTEAKTYTETVSVAEMPADALFGTWSGKFNYNVEMLTQEADGLRFGEKYIVTEGSNAGLYVIFHEDGSATYGGEPYGNTEATLPAGTYEYSTNKITTALDPNNYFNVLDNGAVLEAVYVSENISWIFVLE